MESTTKNLNVALTHKSTTTFDSKLLTSSTPYTGMKMSMGREYKTKKSTLSSKEILEQRERGQCFYCDDKYHPGQECKVRLYTILGEEE